jgi:hypothetical protein
MAETNKSFNAFLYLKPEADPKKSSLNDCLGQLLIFFIVNNKTNISKFGIPTNQPSILKTIEAE